jgi:hypothetical protein
MAAQGEYFEGDSSRDAESIEARLQHKKGGGGRKNFIATPHTRATCYSNVRLLVVYSNWLLKILVRTVHDFSYSDIIISSQ